MKPFHVVDEKLYFSSEEKIFSIQVDRGLFVCGYEESQNRVFLLNTKKDIPSADFFKNIQEQNFSYQNTKIKCVGAKENHDFIVDLFKVKGWSDVKYVDREDFGHELFFYSPSGRLRVEVLNHKNESSFQDSENFVIFEKPKDLEPEVKKKIRVLIVDDSVTIHKVLKRILKGADDIEVVGAVQDPLQVEKIIKDCRPDVLTVDIHMAGLDGVSLLKKILPLHPIPSLLVSSLSLQDGPFVLDGLQAGAVDHIQKPSIDQLDSFAEDIIEKIKMASVAKVKIQEPNSAKMDLAKNISLDTHGFIAMGASTGGTEALANILTQLPAQIPPIVIVQHIPAQFSNAFAKRLDHLCPFTVVEAQNGMILRENTVYIAPGGQHTKVIKHENRLALEVYEGPLVNRHKPSVDVLFDSVLKQVSASKGVAVLLTGMGSDGARGLLQLKNAGFKTIAQDKATSVVFGMPKVAFELGAVDQLTPLPEIPHQIVYCLKKTRKAS